MPNIREMMPSKFLKQEDVPSPLLVTVASLDQQEVNSDKGKDMKWCLHFAELDKPLVLNPTNLQLAAQAFGSEESEGWIGKKIVLYRDPSVSMGGKLVGGLRLRAPKNQAKQPAPQPAPKAGAFDDMEDDIPF